MISWGVYGYMIVRFESNVILCYFLAFGCKFVKYIQLMLLVWLVEFIAHEHGPLKLFHLVTEPPKRHQLATP